MKKTRTVLALTGLLLLAACDQAPFDKKVMAMCEDEHRGMQITLLDSGEEEMPRIAAACRLDQSHKISILGFDGQQLSPLSWHYTEDSVRALSRGLEQSPPSLLASLDDNHNRRIIQMAGNESGEVSEPREIHSTRFSHNDLVVSDVDGDGVRDILMPGEHRWYRNAGTNAEPGPLSRKSLLGDHSRAQVGGSVADINGDGTNDAALRLKPEGRVQLYFHDAQETVVLGEALSSVTDVVGGGDLNGDGVIDLVVGTGGLPEALEVRLVLSDGDEWRLSDPTPALEHAAEVLARDFDGDGTLDLIAAPRVSPGQDDYSLTFLPGNGDGTFGSAGQVDMPAYPYDMVALPADASMGPVVLVSVGESGQLVWLQPRRG